MAVAQQTLVVRRHYRLMSGTAFATESVKGLMGSLGTIGSVTYGKRRLSWRRHLRVGQGDVAPQDVRNAFVVVLATAPMRLHKYPPSRCLAVTRVRTCR